MGGLIPIATATPPQRRDLPLTTGWVRVNAANYWVAQDGKVTVTFRLAKAGGAAIPAGVYHIATLPDECRPSGYQPHAAISTMTTVPALTWVDEDGKIFVTAFGDISAVGGDSPFAWSGFVGTLSFYAS